MGVEMQRPSMAKRRSKREPEDATTPCGIVDCEEDYKRKIATDNVRKAFDKDDYEAERGKVPLCKDHYKDYKKATEDERDLRWLG